MKLFRKSFIISSVICLALSNGTKTEANTSKSSTGSVDGSSSIRAVVRNIEPIARASLEQKNDKMLDLIGSYISDRAEEPLPLFLALCEPYTFISENQTQLLQLKKEALESELKQLDEQYETMLHDSFPKRSSFLESPYTAAYEYAREIEERYGIEIDYGLDSMIYWHYIANPTSSSSMSSIYRHLAMLDEELSKYPEGIFFTALRGISIALVGSYEDVGTLDGEDIVGFAQKADLDAEYYNHNASYYMSLKVNSSDFRQTLHHELGHLLAFRIDPTFETGEYIKFKEIYDRLPDHEYQYRFISNGASVMDATHFYGYQAHDVHEYLSVLYSKMIMNEVSDMDYFPDGSFLYNQACIFRDIVVKEIPEMAEFKEFMTLGKNVLDTASVSIHEESRKRTEEQAADSMSENGKLLSTIDHTLSMIQETEAKIESAKALLK